MISLLVNEKTRQNKTLLASVTGAVRKCSSNIENIRRLDELDTVTILIQLLNYESEVVTLIIILYLAEPLNRIFKAERRVFEYSD